MDHHVVILDEFVHLAGLHQGPKSGYNQEVLDYLQHN
ncbi:hypothetical protein JL09_g7063, partial [Pichia kudriavzevii]